MAIKLEVQPYCNDCTTFEADVEMPRKRYTVEECWKEIAMRLIDYDPSSWYIDTDANGIKRTLNRIYGVNVAENKEDTKMNMINKNRLYIMNKLSIGDKICTSFDIATPREIFAFNYRDLRVGLKSNISAEGCEKFSRFWVDPLTIINPDYYKTPNRIPVPKRIIMSKNSKVTIVLWEDGTKTIVRCAENTISDPYAAYCAAFAKKCYGTNSKLKKTIKKLTVLQDTKVKKEKENENGTSNP